MYHRLEFCSPFFANPLLFLACVCHIFLTSARTTLPIKCEANVCLRRPQGNSSEPNLSLRMRKMVACAKHSRHPYCSDFIDAVRTRVHSRRKGTAIIRRVCQSQLNGKENAAIRCCPCQHRYREAGNFAAEQENTRFSCRLWGVSTAKVCLISTYTSLASAKLHCYYPHHVFFNKSSSYTHRPSSSR